MRTHLRTVAALTLALAVSTIACSEEPAAELTTITGTVTLAGPDPISRELAAQMPDNTVAQAAVMTTS